MKPKIFLLTLTSSLLLFIFAACAPSFTTEQRNATQTAIVEASTIRKTQQAENKPTNTPGPTSTPDYRSDFDKCAQSGIGVRYVVFGTDVTSISTTLENDTGGTEQNDYKLPFCKTMRGFEVEDFLYISAQIQNGTGKITCRIYYLDQLIAEANASGEYSIATCSGSAK